MRILQVIPFFSPEMGGSVQVVYNISKGLIEKGHEVVVVSSDHGLSDAVFENINFKFISFPERFKKLGFFYTPKIISWAREHLKDFDVIHFHLFRTYQNPVISKISDAYNVPWVLSTHGNLPIKWRSKLQKRIYDLLFGNAILSSAKRILAVSPVEVEQLQKRGVERERIKLIYNSFKIEEYSELPARGDFRRNFEHLNEKTKIILYLGRLHIRKKIDKLVLAFSLLQKINENVTLFIIGPDDGEKENLHKLVERLKLNNSIYFCEPIFGREKLSAYVDSDLVVNPAEFEIFGLVPFEALLCNTPVVVSEDSGSGALIRGAGIGYIIPQGSVDVLANTILKALDNVEENHRMVETGKKFIIDNFELDNILGQIEQIYEEAISSNV